MGAIRRLLNLSIMLLVALVGFAGAPRAEATTTHKGAAGERPTPAQGAEPGEMKLEPVAPPREEKPSKPVARPAKKHRTAAHPGRKRHHGHHVRTRGKRALKGKMAGAKKRRPVASAAQPSRTPDLAPVGITTAPVVIAAAEPPGPAPHAPGARTGMVVAAPRDLQPGDVRRILATTRNLAGKNMANLDLQGVDFTGADLTDAVLRNANLNHANFSRANLTRADMTGASLVRANFSTARMQGVQLSEACLFFANLEGADLEQARMRYCYAPGARLDKADLGQADVRDSILWGARFKGSNLAGALVEGTVLAKTTPPIPDYVQQ